MHDVTHQRQQSKDRTFEGHCVWDLLDKNISQGGQRTSYIRVFFFIENFIMAEICQPSDKIKLILCYFNNEAEYF